MTGGAEIRLISVDGADGDVRVALSDGETLELAAGSLPPALPEAGEVVPPGVLEALRDAAVRKRIARRVFRMLDRRLYPRVALRRKLLEAGFPPEPIETVLDRFAAEGLHSDRRYAEAWCRDALASRPVGRRYLVAKLAEKGIDRGLAAAVATELLPPAREAELARAAARAWWRRQRGERDPRTLARGRRFLAGRGFPPAIAGDAVRDAAPGAGSDGGGRA